MHLDAESFTVYMQVICMQEKSNVVGAVLLRFAQSLQHIRSVRRG